MEEKKFDELLVKYLEEVFLITIKKTSQLRDAIIRSPKYFRLVKNHIDK